ncbi:Anthranilate O-methyltransferase 1 [Glycine soja]
MKVIVAKPHPSVGKKNPSKNKVIPKDPGWSKKKGDDIIIQALGRITLTEKPMLEKFLEPNPLTLTFIGKDKTQKNCNLEEVISMVLNDKVQERQDWTSLIYVDIVIVLKKLDKWLKQKDLFTIETLKIIKIGWDANLQEDVDDSILNSKMRGELITKTIRAVFEPLLSAEFGEGIIDELFLRYAKLVAQLIEVETLEHTNVVVPMTKHS